jgi:hypothetical protein
MPTGIEPILQRRNEILLRYYFFLEFRMEQNVNVQKQLNMSYHEDMQLVEMDVLL